MSSLIHHTTCPVCGSSGIHKVLEARDYTVSGEIFEIFQCASCSLRFTQPIPGISSIGNYYSSANYISHSNTNKGIVNSLYHIVRKFTLSGKRKLIGRVTGLNKGTLLDIGAGTGSFVHHMKNAGWQTTGLEPDPDAIKKALSLHGVSLRSSESIYELPAESFDVITMWHVLEHVHDLQGYLAHIKKICKKGGRIFIAIPNYTSYDAGKYGACWAAYDVPRHLYHFSPASMTILLERHGMKLESIQPMLFDSYYVSLLSEKYKRGKSNLLKGFWNGFVSNSKAFSNKRKASSIVYIIST